MSISHMSYPVPISGSLDGWVFSARTGIRKANPERLCSSAAKPTENYIDIF
jgi:hypothetical protein